MPKKTHVLIIGAGPAGLAAALCLKKQGIDFTVLERGDRVLSALRGVDPDMNLLSPMRLSRMPGMELDPDFPTYPRFADYLDLLEAHVAHRAIKVITGATVTLVTKQNHRFEMVYQTREGHEKTLSGSHVIYAAGMIGAPQLPAKFDPQATSLPWFHSLNARAEHLRRARRLLVVGGGASAAEVLERWLEVRQPQDRAWISLRSRLVAIWKPIFGIDPHYYAWLPEQMPVRPFGWRVNRLREPMLGRAVVKSIKKGWITKVAATRACRGQRVELADGAEISPDLIVFATGFRYQTDPIAGLVENDPDGMPLVRRCESTCCPGLFLLGFRFGRTFASPYLRGIARDARYVSRKIARETGV